jgi:hypothetical protein
MRANPFRGLLEGMGPDFLGSEMATSAAEVDESHEAHAGVCEIARTLRILSLSL